MGAVRFGQKIDLQMNQMLNAIVHSGNGTPSDNLSRRKGQLYYNTADNRFYVCNGSTWELRATSSDVVYAGLDGSSNPTYANGVQLRDRSTHTGKQAASTISDFDTATNTRKITDFTGTPDKELKLGNQKITGLADGVAGNDGVNINQLDAVRQIAMKAIAGVAIKEPVLAVAVTQTALSGITTIDGVTIPVNGRFLLAGQTDATQNGIYYKNSGNAAVRTTDADEAGELVPGTQVFVTQGTANGDSAWAIVSDTSITPGTNTQQWAKVPGSTGSNYTWGNGLQNTGGTISVKPGSGITATAAGVNIDTALVVRKYVGPVAGASPIVINHGLGTADVTVQVRDLTNTTTAPLGDLVYVGVSIQDANNVVLDFDATTVPANSYRVIVTG